VVKYLKGRNARIDDLEGGVNVDSDCEGDSTGANDGELKMEDEETLAVLIAGSFSACALSRPILTLRGMTSSPVGNLFSSIAAQILSLSLPSNRKASTIA